jgi:hypothetical protein
MPRAIVYGKISNSLSNYSKQRKINLKYRKEATAVLKELCQYVFVSES